jgi:OOP family OmpA-OmpF porin
MKTGLLFYALVLGGSCAFAQTPASYNHWSLEAALGINNPTKPFTKGYFTDRVGWFHADLGTRYMFNRHFGLKADLGFDQISAAAASPDFRTQYWRISLQGVINVGNVLHFHEWTDVVGLLVHGGGGFASLTDKHHRLGNGSDEMLHYVLGFAPQFRISDRVALSADLTMQWNVYQSQNFDLHTPSDISGIDGRLLNASVGLTYYLGKNKEHVDWSPDPMLEQMRLLEGKLSELEQKMMDADQDGVADYLDQEKASAPNANVNSKGQTVVVEKELIVVVQPAPDTDRDGDGIRDEIDVCPDEAGIMANKGCPEIKEAVREIISHALEQVQFKENTAELIPESYNVLNEMAVILIENPGYLVEIHGHTDSRGTYEANQALSEIRCDAVKSYLVRRGVDGSRLEIFGHGEMEPVTSNLLAPGRAKNRRVEFRIKFSK